MAKGLTLEEGLGLGRSASAALRGNVIQVILSLSLEILFYIVQ
jgi:hypothetical protein